MLEKYSKSTGADLGIHDFGNLCEGQLRDRRTCVDLTSLCFWKNLPFTHMCLQDVECRSIAIASEKGLSFLFHPWWAWFASHFLSSSSFVLSLIWKSASGKGCQEQRGKRWNIWAVVDLPYQNECQTFHWTSRGHRTRFKVVECILSSWKTSFSSSSCLSSFSTQKGSPHRERVYFFEVKKAPLIGNMSFFFKVKKASPMGSVSIFFKV